MYMLWDGWDFKNKYHVSMYEYYLLLEWNSLVSIASLLFLLRHKCGQMLSRLIVIIILQYLQVLNNYIIYLKKV